jgi:glycosyltransferase involved in cell wall biosynthesis
MRVLHIVKTADGASWAAEQAEHLARLGVEVHVALPAGTGRAIPLWRRAGATVHIADVSLPVMRPWLLAGRVKAARRLVDDLCPDLIHTHFVTNTLLIRSALGRNHPVRRIYQVAGPLHLEYAAYRTADLRSAGPEDYWIGSSLCIVRLYIAAGVPNSRVFLSYYGSSQILRQTERTWVFRRSLGIPDSEFVVGNANLMYPPKRYLGHRVGIKCHEDVIDALGVVMRKRHNVTGLLIGGEWGGGRRYETRLRERAARRSPKILMPGFIEAERIQQLWPDFDCAVHVPLTENCGGVIEPLAAGVPTIASNVGGLPEIVVKEKTGKVVPVRDPSALADAIVAVLEDIPGHRRLANAGQALVRNTFDVRRTAAEVLSIYRQVTGLHAGPPGDFNVAGSESRSRANVVPSTVQQSTLQLTKYCSHNPRR